MFSESIIYNVREREARINNVDTTEWCLEVSFDTTFTSPWVVHVWNHKPVDKEVNEVIYLGLRFIDLYIKSYTKPRLPTATQWR